MAERKEERGKEKEDASFAILSELKDIKEALLGSTYNPKGLIARVEKLEDYKEGDKKFKWMLAGGTIAISTFLKSLMTKLLVALGLVS